VWRLVPDPGRIRQDGGFDIDDGGERLVRDFDEVQASRAAAAGLRDDNGDRLFPRVAPGRTGEACLAGSRARRMRRDTGPSDGRPAGARPSPAGGVIVTGIGQKDAGRGKRRRHIDRGDPGVRMASAERPDEPGPADHGRPRRRLSLGGGEKSSGSPYRLSDQARHVRGLEPKRESTRPAKSWRMSSRVNASVSVPDASNVPFAPRRCRPLAH